MPTNNSQVVSSSYQQRPPDQQTSESPVSNRSDEAIANEL